MKKKSVSAENDVASPSPDSLAESTPGTSSFDPEELARLAYSYWEARGGQDGSPEEDWYRAERELEARAADGK